MIRRFKHSSVKICGERVCAVWTGVSGYRFVNIFVHVHVHYVFVQIQELWQLPVIDNVNIDRPIQRKRHCRILYPTLVIIKCQKPNSRAI